MAKEAHSTSGRRSCLCFGGKSQKELRAAMTERTFYLNDGVRNSIGEKYQSNYIRTTKYTSWNFLPLSLLYQFKRKANIYFLLQAILNSIPAISALNPVTAILPLAFVLGVSMLREGLEDYQRYKSDVKTNRQPIKFVKGGTIVMGQAKEVKVGDLLLINENEEFPADVILVASSYPDASCFIQTSSLDGEKNLKTKRTPKNLDKLIPSGIDFHPSDVLITGHVVAEPPNGNLYSFNGKMNIGNKFFPLTHEQMLLKGTQLKNTKWVVGFVVYTGKETRIMMNSQLGSYKLSNVEQKMNMFVIQIFIAQLVLTTSIAVLGGYWHSQAAEKTEDGEPVHFYIEFGYSSIFEGFLTFVRYIQLLNTLIPISLYVTAEMIKFFIAWFIGQNADMYMVEKGQGTEVKNMSIIEDLGQLHYIFTDKTGTLTCNQMEFRSMCVGEEVFGSQAPDVSDKTSNMEQSGNKDPRLTVKKGQSQEKDRNQQTEVVFDKARFDEYIQGRSSAQPINLTLTSVNGQDSMRLTSQGQLMREFMTIMSVAHEVVADDPSKLSSFDDEDEDMMQVAPEKLIYQGPSPDEVTLVEFARERGFSFIMSNDSFAKVQVQHLIKEYDLKSNPVNDQSALTYINNKNGIESEDEEFEFDRNARNIRHRKSDNVTNELRFQIEKRIEFTSTRKRMSILVLDPRDNRFKLYVKGADSEIKKRLKKGGQDPGIEQAVEEFTEQASEQGLRTLYFAMKIIEQKELERFHYQVEQMEQVLTKKEERLELLYSNLESDLTLLGATAVEDQLQENVPEVIHDLQRANIKVWMLTGDKFETAKNIGASCRLIQKGDECYELKSKQDVARVCSADGVHYNEKLMLQNKRRVLIVQNEALATITASDQFRGYFIRISKTCEAVICCRVSPKQKADVVKMIKMGDKGLLTMAVGDGNNDVSMINEAHVGVGLYGSEGLRAVQASDFAIPEFQKLWRLIFVHGRSRYASISSFILYFFYKNVALTLPHYYYAYFCGFSAMTVFDEWYIQLYNIIFTSLPVILLGVLDWDIHPDIDGPEYKDFLPLLYYQGQYRDLFNSRQFFFAQFQGLVHSAIIFYVTFITYSDSSILNSSKGYSTDLWTGSVAAFTALVFTVNLNLLIRMKYLTYLHGLSVVLVSYFSYLGFMWFTNFVDFGWTQHSVLEAHRSNVFYLTIALTCGSCFALDYFYDSYQVLLNTSPAAQLRQVISRGSSINNQIERKKFYEISDKAQKRVAARSTARRKITDHRQILLNQMLQDINHQSTVTGTTGVDLAINVDEHAPMQPIETEKDRPPLMQLQPVPNTNTLAPPSRLETNSTTHLRPSLNVVPSTVQPKPTFKAQGIIIARASIDSAFDNQSVMRDDLDASAKMGGGSSKAGQPQAEMMTYGGQNSMTMLKSPYNEASFTQSIITAGMGQPSIKSPNDLFDAEVSRIALLGNENNQDYSISQAHLRELETPVPSVAENQDETGASLRINQESSVDRKPPML